MAVAPEYLARPEAGGFVGEVWADVVLDNFGDAELARRGQLAPDAVRRVSLRMLVDTGCRSMVLPEAIVNQLGLGITGSGRLLYAGRAQDVPVADAVRVTVLGRQAFVQPTVAPNARLALLGELVLEATDLLVDCPGKALVPRDPTIVTSFAL